MEINYPEECMVDNKITNYKKRPLSFLNSFLYYKSYFSISAPSPHLFMVRALTGALHFDHLKNLIRVAHR